VLSPTPTPTPDDPLISAQIGNYQVVDRLGQGGMGVVYLVRHPLLGRELAVKVLSAEWGKDPESLERFKREALAANQVGHRAIVDVYDFGALPDGRSYYVMERLSGRSLRDELEARGRLPADEALTRLRPILEALAAAHAAGIVHRDLKPDNIFLQQDGAGRVWPRLLDFGIAKLGEDSRTSRAGITHEGEMLGTPYYLPPEQARGALAEIGPWSDVYALGAVLHHVLTGAPPYPSRSVAAVLLGHLDGPIPSTREQEPSVPEALDAVVRRCLAKAPGDRYPDAAALLEALGEVPASAPDLLAATRLADSGPVVAARVPVASRPSGPDPAATTSPIPGSSTGSTTVVIRDRGLGFLGLALGLLLGGAVMAFVFLRTRPVERPGPAPAPVAARDPAARALPPDGTPVAAPAADAALPARDAAPPPGPAVPAVRPASGNPPRALAPAPRPRPDPAPPRSVDASVPEPPRFDIPQAERAAKAMFLQKAAALERCYQNALKQGRLTGAAEITLVINVTADGEATRVSVFPEGLERRALQSCFHARILVWRFPRATKPYEIRVSLSLTP
jgi:serine/threonine-protein kinase